MNVFRFLLRKPTVLPVMSQNMLADGSDDADVVMQSEDEDSEDDGPLSSDDDESSEDDDADDSDEDVSDDFDSDEDDDNDSDPDDAQ